MPPIPYELRIGVTGHRRLERLAEVERAVEQAIGDVIHVLTAASVDPLGPHGSVPSRTDTIDRFLAHLFPGVPTSPRQPTAEQQTPLKLTVISALAAGADQMVARVVCGLVTEPARRNRYVEAVLPFTPAEYERDFQDDGELEAFRSFLALDRGRLNTHPEPTVCFPHFPNAVDIAGRVREVRRDEGYAAAGKRVVDTSEIVVAVWDPVREARPGGTAETARYALGRGRVVLWINPADLGAGTRLLRWHDGVPQADTVPSRAKKLSENFHRLAAYNRDGAVNAARLQAQISEQARTLATTAETSGLPSSMTDTLVAVLLPIVLRADHISERYRRLRDFSALVWPVSAALVVSLIAFQILFLPDHYWLAYLELLVLLIGYAWNRVSLHEAWHEKWLNDRRLAEGLRTAMFAALAYERDDGVVSEANAQLPFYNPANAWFVSALKRVVAKERRQFASKISNEDARHAVVQFLRDAWVLDQAVYHERNAQRHHSVVRRAHRLRLGMIAALAVIAVLHALGVGHDSHAERPLTRLDLWIGFAAVALPAWAACFHVMSLEDHERLAKRSQHMAPLLRGLAEQLGAAHTPAALRDCVAEIERLTDLESAEWAESLMDRRPEFTG